LSAWSACSTCWSAAFFIGPCATRNWSSDWPIIFANCSVPIVWPSTFDQASIH